MDAGSAVKFGFLHNGPLDMVGLTEKGAVMHIEVMGKSSARIEGDDALVVDGIVFGKTLESALADLLRLLGKPFMVFDEDTPDDEVIQVVRGERARVLSKQQELWAKLDVNPSDLDFMRYSTRITTFLRNKGIRHLGELVRTTESQRKAPNFGEASQRAMDLTLERLGLFYGMNTMNWLPPDHPSRAGTQA